MRVVEKQVLSKTTEQDDCEDKIVVTNDFVGVIDGATSKGAKKINGISLGQIAATVVEESVHELEPGVSIQDATVFFTEKLKNYYRENNLYGVFENSKMERPSASVALYSRFRSQVWLIGDCQCIIEKKTYTNSKKIDSVLAQIRALFLKMELVEGKTLTELQVSDTGREYIMPLLKKQFLFQNLKDENQLAYGVIDGFPFNDKLSRCIDVGYAKGKLIVLATDGYPKIFTGLKRSEVYLSQILKKDPLMFRIHKSTKGLQKGNVSFDDRAYIKLEL